MKKFLIYLSVALAITACASSNKNDKNLTTNFIGGDIKVTFNKKGEFESLTSKAVAKVASDLPSAKDEAVTIATVRARRNIAEFLNTEVQSERFITSLSTTVQESESDNKSPNTKENAKIAYEVRESIKQRSNAILQGTYVESESYDDNQKSIIVIVRTGSKESGAAKGLRKVMGQ
jgi:hypothetical protein